jgi:NTP pyrophosphatase (non-canonical NTP hydrolase)
MTTFNEYQEDAASTAVFPRFYTEDQVRRIIYDIAEENWGTSGEPEESARIVAWANGYLDQYETALSRLVYPILGLVGEAGELANKLKKWGRDSTGQSTPDQEDALADELGDTLWYQAAVATGLKQDLEGIAEANISKLFSRQQRGVIQGSGDTR